MQSAFERYPALQKAVMGDDAGKKGKKSKVKLAIFAPQLQKFASNIGPNLGSQLLATALAALGGVFTFIIALLLVAFILISPRPLVAGFLSAVPERHREAAGRSVARISSQMLAWVRATLINGLITGVSTGILLYFLGVQPAFIFGILSCLGEFVPNLGPIAASIPALFVAAGMGTNKLLLTGVAYFFVQQLESNVLVPFIMGGQMELHPVTIVFFALAMGSLFGITGAILAVPTAAVIKVLFDEFYLKPNRVPVEEINKRTQSVILDREWPEKSTLS